MLMNDFIFNQRDGEKLRLEHYLKVRAHIQRIFHIEQMTVITKAISWEQG